MIITVELLYAVHAYSPDGFYTFREHQCFLVERLQPHPPRRVVGVDWRDMVSVYDGLRPCLIEERGFYGKQFGWGKYYFDKRVVLLRNPSCYKIA